MATNIESSNSVTQRFSTIQSRYFCNDSGAKSTLRLLPQAVYQYSNSSVLWGGVFAMAIGTDPEAFLQLEARRDSGEVHWYYGFARMTGRRLQAKLDAAVVWEVERAPVWSGEHEYLFCINAATIPIVPNEE